MKNTINGTVTKWNDAKGFGFITPESDAGETFFHISAFKNQGARPTLGLKVVFTPEQDKQGRNRASQVRPITSTSRPKKNRRNPAFNAFFTSALFLFIVAALTVFNFIPAVILWLYLGASLLAYIIYAWDKSAARGNQRRMPEATLHLIAAAGGWPGALFAQQHLRHKSKKQEFRVVFWLTVIGNIGVLIYLLTPYGSGLLNDINTFIT